MINDVIFLGAGASAAEGAPIQANLFKDYFTYIKQAQNVSSNDEMDQILANFFRDFFGIDVNGDLTGVPFPIFEEVLGVLELALNRNECFKGYQSIADEPRIQKVRECLILLIAVILGEKLQTPNLNHMVLTNRLKGERSLMRTLFLSLSYDIIIDNVLTNLYPDYDLYYGVHFMNYDLQDEWHKPDYTKAVSLYKLHGSLNWLYCPTCISLKLTPKQKGIANLRWDIGLCICKRCGSRIIPIVIPPTFFKVMSNYYLQEVWRCAEMKLSRANRLIFCGYSFPDADIHIKYLLKRIELNRSDGFEVYIVNNHQDKPENVRREEEQRYRRFFRDGKSVNYTDLSFQKFCVNGLC